MAKDMGKVKVEYQSIEDSEREAREHPYTVPIPEGLTEEFFPSKPVTDEQMMRWMTRHIEPYPGYADEEAAWERAWQEVEIAQLKADGEPVLELDPVHVDPEFDPSTGKPIVYDEPHIVQNPDNGEADLFIDTADLTEDELKHDDSQDSEK
ncbi:hypothetical protein [Bifidobacterium sp. SO1]|uniref:hypothetical protein n=1 Tax=Bifidobacterium sp. SO1 TaxID=2809029 RepID=UPI001F0A335D|nr:hypothetical protein [Bifidobacterium sp. SO1]